MFVIGVDVAFSELHISFQEGCAPMTVFLARAMMYQEAACQSPGSAPSIGHYEEDH